MINNPSENIWEKFIKTSKTGLSMESLNGDLFHFFTKIFKSFVLNGSLGIHLLLETFQRFSPNLLNLPVTIVSGGGDKALLYISCDHMINE